jgi:clan AA aspartic protease (TIGR02281 family)
MSRFTAWFLRSATVSLVLTAILSSSAFASRSDYFKGVSAYRSGDYQAAMNAFETVLETQPQNVNAHYYRALIEDRLGHPNSALQDYRYVTHHSHEGKVVAYAQERALAMAETGELKPEIAMLPPSGAPLQARLNMTVTPSTAPMRVQLKPSRNALLLNARLTQQSRQTQGDLIVDTGATYTSISQQMAEELGLDLVSCAKVHITTANGRIEVPKVIIETLNVNGLEAHNIEATVIPVRPGSSFSGLLGLSFLRNFIVTIDAQGGSLVFSTRQ